MKDRSELNVKSKNSIKVKMVALKPSKAIYYQLLYDRVCNDAIRELVDKADKGIYQATIDANTIDGWSASGAKNIGRALSYIGYSVTLVDSERLVITKLKKMERPLP